MSHEITCQIHGYAAGPMPWEKECPHCRGAFSLDVDQEVALVGHGLIIDKVLFGACVAEQVKNWNCFTFEGGIKAPADVLKKYISKCCNTEPVLWVSAVFPDGKKHKAVMTYIDEHKIHLCL